MGIRVNQAQILSRLIAGDKYNEIIKRGKRGNEGEIVDLLKTKRASLDDVKLYGRVATRISGTTRAKAKTLELHWSLLVQLASIQTTDEAIKEFLQKCTPGTRPNERELLLSDIQNKAIIKQQKMIMKDTKEEESSSSAEEEFISHLEALASGVEGVQKSMRCLCNLLTDYQLDKHQSLRKFLQ